MAATRTPVLFLPHGGGPCFQLPDGAVGPRGIWGGMRRYLQGVSVTLPAKPAALLVCVPSFPRPAGQRTGVFARCAIATRTAQHKYLCAWVRR